MATVKSSLITDALNPDVQVGKGFYAAEKVVIAEYTAAGVLADNTVILLCEIPVSAKITSIRLSSDDLGDTGLFNLGFYPGPGSGVTIATDADAVDEDIIATAIDLNAAAISDVEVRFEVANLTTMSDKAWELAGLSAKPAYGTFYLALTASQATTVGGDLGVIVRYTE